MLGQSESNAHMVPADTVVQYIYQCIFPPRGWISTVLLQVRTFALSAFGSLPFLEISSGSSFPVVEDIARLRRYAA